jgi:glycosyltransferase involved in cell wall biosynthesis
MLVFPSLIEGFGLVLLEAFEAKKPVLVSDVSPSNEIVENAIDGFILRPVDAKN